jgi:hypothetical protein
MCVCVCVCGKKREKRRGKWKRRRREYLRLIEWWIKGVYELQHMDQGVLRAKQNNDSNDPIVFGESRRRTRCTTCSWEMKRMHSLPQSRDPVCRIYEKAIQWGEVEMPTFAYIHESWLQLSASKYKFTPWINIPLDHTCNATSHFDIGKLTSHSTLKNIEELCDLGRPRLPLGSKDLKMNYRGALGTPSAL